jgi:hypothetical protein
MGRIKTGDTEAMGTQSLSEKRIFADAEAIFYQILMKRRQSI